MTRIKINKSLRSLRLGLVFLFTLLMSANSWGYIFYINENGEREPVSLFNYLSKDIDHMTLMQNNGIYVVNDTVDLGDKNIGFEGRITIILMDGAYLNCNKLYYKKDLGLSDVPSISIFVGSTSYYKPILGTGVLNVKNGIDPTTASNVSIAIYGGHVTTDYNNPKNDSHKDNVRIDVQNFEFHGGNVDVEELEAKTITLGWKNPTDSFRVRNFIRMRESFTIENDLYVKDENGKFYSGQLSVDNIYSILDKTLVPAKTPFFYMDENGVERGVEDYVILDTLLPKVQKDPYSNDRFVYLPSGWYVVNDRVTFEGQIYFRKDEGDANLIIADNAELNVVDYEKDILFGISGQGNLNVYGQKNGSGKLNVYSQKSTSPYVQGDLSAGRNKDLIINGISVKVGGQLFASNGRVKLNGGSYDVNTVFADLIILDWRKTTDSIKVEKFSLGNFHQPGKFLQIAEGKAFGDEDGKVYTGKVYSTETVYDENWKKDEYLSPLNGKTLKPCYAVTFQALNGTEPVVAAATFDEQGYANIAEPPAPTRNGSKFYRWSTTEDGTRGYFFNIPVTENMTLFAQWNKDRVEYIDNNGQSRFINPDAYVVLTSDLLKANEEDGVVNLPRGWYVVHNTFYDSVDVYVEDYTLSFNGDAHIILADGAEMKLDPFDRMLIEAKGNLSIYGQKLGTGKLTAIDSTADNSAIVVKGRNFDINGGNITVRNSFITGRTAVTSNTVNINGGVVNISSNNEYAFDPVNAIEAKELNLNSYRLDDRFTIGLTGANVNVASGKSFKDDANEIYSGTLDAKQIETLVDRTLIPAIEFPSNIAVADIPDMTYIGDSICPQPAVRIGNSQLTLDEDYIVVCEDNLNVGTAKLTVQGAGNYYGEVEKTFNIVKAPLTIKAKDTTIVYGSDAPEALTIVGLVGADTLKELSEILNGTLSYDCIYTAGDTVSSYTIMLSGNVTADNYEIELMEGVFTVEPKEVSIVWDKQTTFTYDGKEHAPTATLEGLFGRDRCDLTLFGAKVNVGEYTASVIDLSNPNYKLPETGLDQAFEITKAPLTVTAFNDTIVYGDEPSNAGVKFSGFVNGENEKSLNGTLVYSNEYKQYGNVGEYAISPSGLSADNYEINFIDGKLTVEPKYVAVTWDKRNTFTYDGSEHAPTATLEGVLESDKCGFTIAGAAVNAGKYTASVTELDNENYKLPETAAKQDFEITKASLTVAAKNETMVYGDEPSNAGVEFSGFIGEDNEKSLNGALVYSYNYKQYDNIGEYTITPSGLTSDNYEITFVDGMLTVEPKEVTIIWGEQTLFVYDGAEHIPSVKSLEGVVNGETCSAVVEGAAVNVGKYTAKVTDLSDKNYKLPKNGVEQVFEIVAPNFVVEDIPVQAYTGNSVCPDVVVRVGQKTLEAKLDYIVECFENVEKSSTAPYAKITGMGKYAGVVEKHFAILERTADYAAVGIFKDENGHSIAAIDGNFGEDGSVNIDEEITVDSVMFERCFSKGSRSTIVLPFSVSTRQIKGLKQVLGFSKIVVENGQKAVGMHIVWENTSSEHVTLNAYTPYIVLMDGEKFDIGGAVTLEVTKEVVDAGSEDNSEWEFRGSLTYKKWEENDPELGRIYGFAGNADDEHGIEVGDFVKVAAGAWIAPMRAYLVKKPSASGIRANGARIAKAAANSELQDRMSIVIIKNDENGENNEQTTVIGQFNTRTAPYRMTFMPRTYDIKGRNVGEGKKAKGVYLKK